MTKYESQVYTLNTTQAEAYARMADLRRFEVIKQALSDPERLQAILQHAPEGQVTPERLEENARLSRKYDLHRRCPFGRYPNGARHPRHRRT